MTEFRTDKLSDAQRLAALEQRMEELEAQVDGMLQAAFDLGDLDGPEEEPLTEEEQAEADRYFREGPL